MLSDEEKKEYEELKSLLYTGTISQYGKRKLIDIIEKQQKEIEENKENWLLAQNELLGYVQGYEDGKKHTQTATSMIVENRQYEILGEEIKKYKNIIEKQSKEIEEIIERLEAKPYTAYTLYGDILHESDEIAQMLKDVLEKE